MSSETTRRDVGLQTALPFSLSVVPVGVVTLLGTIARIYGLAGRRLPTDEAITLAFIQEFSVRELVTVLPALQPHFPTYYVILDAWLSLVGITATNARVASAVAGILTIPAIYVLGAELHTRRAGLLAATFCAVSPYHIALSQTIRMYSLLGLIAVVSWVALLRARPTIYAVAAILVIYLHYFGVLVVAGQWLYLAWAHRHRLPRDWQQSIGTVGLAAFPGVAWIAYRTTTETTGSNVRVVGLEPPTLVEFSRFPFQFLLGDFALHARNFTAACLIVGGGVLVVSLAQQGLRDWRLSKPDLFLAGGLLLPATTLFAVSHLLKPVFRARYLVMAALTLYVLLGVGYTRLPRRKQLLMATIIVLSAGAATPAAYATGGSEWTQAESYLDQHVEETDGVVLVGLFGRESAIRQQQLGVPVVDARKTLQHVPRDALHGFEDVFLVRFYYGTQTPQPSLAAVGLADTHRIAGETRISKNLIIYRVRHDTPRRPVA